MLLALVEDFKKFRSCIEAKEASLFVAADKGDLIFVSSFYVIVSSLTVPMPGNKPLYMRLLVEDIDFDILWSMFHEAMF